MRRFTQIKNLHLLYNFYRMLVRNLVIIPKILENSEYESVLFGFKNPSKNQLKVIFSFNE